MKDENPHRYLDYLQQCLSSDKKPLGIFLGAGCPMAVRVGEGNREPLIPDIMGITDLVCEELAKCEECAPLLQKIKQHFANDERTSFTVEDVLTHIRALRAVAGKEEVRGLSATGLDQIDDKICQTIQIIVDKSLPSSVTPYHNIASWTSSIRREHPIEIFTTNYDLLMEQAFEEYGVPYFDGFAGGRMPYFDLQAMEEDALPPRWARLWKLHGSINWYQTGVNGVYRSSVHDTQGSKRVIHPSHLKYHESRRMPYLAMIDRLRSFLKRSTSTLVLCGYSFRDEHINEVIVQGLQYTQTAITFALFFDKISEYPQAVTLAQKCPNLNLLARDGAVISGQELKWVESDASSISPVPSKWVDKVPLDPTDVSGKYATQLLLGDFALFGNFLQELVGTVREVTEMINAK